MGQNSRFMTRFRGFNAGFWLQGDQNRVLNSPRQRTDGRRWHSVSRELPPDLIFPHPEGIWNLTSTSLPRVFHNRSNDNLLLLVTGPERPVDYLQNALRAFYGLLTGCTRSKK
jgi:hypothetical protein